ncbi:MAG TPA: DUF5691 domain-containing protein [Dongiaceae bacterium]
MADLESSLTRIRSAWMAGRSALEHCPPEWRDVVAGEDGECALAALASHATSVLFRPAPAAPIEPRPLLPTLALPTVPDAARSRLNRVLAAQKSGAALERPLVDLVTARGFAMHPGDWMPSARDDWAPDLYAPWLDWVRAEGKAAPASGLTAETYDQLSWAERRVELAALRERDPDAARAIIAAKAASEPAERRVKLIEILESKLSESDAEFLESLASDRSDRVRALAGAYLARLGRGTDGDAPAKELAEMLEIGKVGLLHRRTQLTTRALKTQPQNARRLELFRLVSFASLARALGLSEQHLLETAPTGVADAIAAFVQMVAATGSDEACRLLFDRILDDAEFPFRDARTLAPRLSADERRALLPRIMKRDGDMFETTLAMMGRTLGEAPLSALSPSSGHTALKNILDAALTGEEAQRQNSARMLEMALGRIALLIDPAAATDLIKRLTGWGLSPADPKLDLLHLNAALIPEMKS